MKSADISRNCGGLNLVDGKVNHRAVADVATTAGITGGAGKRTADCGRRYSPSASDEAVSVRFKAAGSLHIVGATADVS
ncbi:hypothetical protein ACNKHT_01380 [Shigella flexneri]